MRSLTRAAKRKLFGIGASVTAGAMIIAGGAGLSAVGDPTDVSEGWGKFLGGSALGIDLDTLLELESALAETPSGSAAEDVPLTATALNAITVGIGALDLLGDNGILQLGAVEQLAQADANGDAFAGSGAVSDSSGSIAIDDEPGEDFANASLDLTALAANAGLEEIIGALRLEIGALASTAEEVQGVVDSEYTIADLSLVVESSAVEDIYGTLSGTVGGLQTTLNGLAASLNTALSVELLGVVDANAAVGLTAPNLAALLPSGPLGSGAVTVDLTDGTITVDIEQIMSDNGDDINSLDPNTELLSPEVIGWIVDDVTETVTSIVQTVLTNVVAAVQNTALSGTVSVGILGETLVLNIGGTIATPSVTIGTTGPLLTTIATLLATLTLGTVTIDNLATAVSGLLTGALSGVLTTLTTFSTTVAGIVDGLELDVVNPLLVGLDGLVNLTANQQPTSEPINAATGDLPGGSFTVRALQITLLGAAAPLAQVNLASSTVRGTIAVVDADTDVDVDVDVDTDVDADADIDADVDVDAPDADADADADADVDADTDADVDADTDVDVDADTDTDADGTAGDADADADADGTPSTGGGTKLPNTGLDSLWLIGFGSLLLLAGAGTLLVRRRDV